MKTTRACENTRKCHNCNW